MSETIISPEPKKSGEFLFRGLDLRLESQKLEALGPEKRVAWAMEHFGDRLILSSSFGVQAAVCLHMVTLQKPDVPVVLIDTGYLFPETYRFIDQLTDRLSLNLKVYRSSMSPAWQEARFGKLWEKGKEGIDQYNQMNKVEPMNQALNQLNARAWIAGLRRQQSSTRMNLPVIALSGERLKVHPIIDWSSRDVHHYLKKHDLPYHPLWEQGYVSIGDTHTTHRVEEGSSEEESRFFGLKRECGLHDGVNTDFSI